MPRNFRFALLLIVAACSVPDDGCAELVKLGDNMRLTFHGPEGDTTFDAGGPTVAYNSTANQYLMAWGADDDNSNENIFVQPFDTLGGPLGDAVPLSDSHYSSSAALDFNATDNEYLVVWRQNRAEDGKVEIYGRRIDENGGPQGDSFLIGSQPPVDENNLAARQPAIAYNSTDNEYLVTWHGQRSENASEIEIFGQLIGGLGNLRGDNFRISYQGPDGDRDYDALGSSIAYNSAGNEYLVTWGGDRIAGEKEIYGQRLDRNGNFLGGDFRISTQGPEGDVDFDAVVADIAYNATGNEYLVAWRGDRIDDETEIYGQLLNSSGDLLGNNFRISTQTPDGDTNIDAVGADITYNATADEYLITWHGDRIVGEDEVYGQRVDSSGTLLGDNFRISRQVPDGDVDIDASGPAIAFNATDNEYLVTWHGDRIDGEVEIYGQRLRVPVPDGDFTGDGIVSGNDFLAWQRDPSIGNLTDWQANYGAASLLETVASIPEPTSGLLLLFTTLIALARRRPVQVQRL